MIEFPRRFVMDQVNVHLENCYGIKKLRQQFDFSKERVFAIYAPNGAMKSSFAQTFQDLADATPSTDRIFPTRPSKRSITDTNGVDLTKESIFVARPVDQELGHTEKTSTLLVHPKLRKEYEQLHVGIEQAKVTLIAALKKQSRSKKPIEQELSSTFTSSDDQFRIALTRIKQELMEQKDAPFADVHYDKIFDDKVLSALRTKDLKTAIEGYVQRYNELLAASTYFKKGTFDYYNASQIARALADNGFFAAKHSVNLNATERLEVRTQKELEDVIAREKDAIIKDKALRKNFDEIAALLQKNVTLRDFQSYMLENEALLSQLANVNKFREDVWKSYLKAQFVPYMDLMQTYDDAAARERAIEAEAAKQRTQWEAVIQIFNERFFVPFTLTAKNRTAVLLGYAPIIDLGFTYHDGADQVEVDKAALLKALSTGERRAFYILNVLFEIEARKKAKQETLMVIDDIADSFDYQNKYAIIQYLKEISEDPLFKQIIMTHNFDFFRTINSRFVVGYSHCLMATRSASGISIDKATGIRNVFVNDWKEKFFTDPKKKIASIPFMRNLIEFTRGETDATFLKLTSLVHWKADSDGITESQLDEIYNQMFTPAGASANSAKRVVDIIHEQAALCMSGGAGVNLENRIVLAIAIRIGAERFMAERINDRAFVAGITANQTPILLDKFRELLPGDTETIRILGKVVLMTPENIHLNSFMYEPIVDMSDDHLRRLYADVLKLK
jgi:hypothetical protein